MKKHYFFVWYVFIYLLFISLSSCDDSFSIKQNFDTTNNRVWIDEEFWAVPMEDWRVNDGRIECVGDRGNMRVNIINSVVEEGNDLSVQFRIGCTNIDASNGAAGIRFAIKDKTDSDYRSLCYFGEGINAGVDKTGKIFLANNRENLPEGFDFEDISVSFSILKKAENYLLRFNVQDRNKKSASIETETTEDVSGMLALVNNFHKNSNYEKGARFWFDDLQVKGSMLREKSEQTFGPVLWSMYTLSRNTLKMSAQMPPLGDDDNKTVILQLKKGEKWENAAESEIEKDARIAVFKLKDWNSEIENEYRLVYTEKYKDGSQEEKYYNGIIRSEPVNKPLEMGGLTCQYHYGFPYAPLVDNLRKQNPDILYFSGDQIYEGNGGYGIIRFPADRSILNYLGKWYMFGWAFGDLMRNRPTICIPDDHEVFQGNLWGDGGKKVSAEQWGMAADCLSGFVEPKEMVQVVMHTNCAHLPDPYDSTPMQQGIDVYYTDLVYGGVSFAIVGDRIFKTGPEVVSYWEGRKDHIKKPLRSAKELESPEFKLLGDRQLEFLHHWTKDWDGARMKCLLSQTVFANSATHHGADKMFLLGDMDSGAWPKTGRDKVVDILRKTYSFHICGDQHLPTMQQYGIDEYRDGSWVFCTPAIAVGYQRRFLPDMLGWPVIDRPEHGNANTGSYTDVFGNKNFIYAVGNPDETTDDPNRYIRAQKCASGYGLIRFNCVDRIIESNAYHFLADLDKNFPPQQFPGWPKTISQFDNYGKTAVAFLPELVIKGDADPVVEISDDLNNLVSIVRIKGNNFQPKVYKQGKYQLRIGYPEKNIWKTLQGIDSFAKLDNQKLEVLF